MTPQRVTGGSGWKRRLTGLFYLGVGSVFGLFAVGLIWAVGGMVGLLVFLDKETLLADRNYPTNNSVKSGSWK